MTPHWMDGHARVTLVTLALPLLPLLISFDQATNALDDDTRPSVVLVLHR